MDSLLNTLKWSAAVGVAVLLLTLLKPALDRRYSARWRYWVWLAMAVLLLLAPVRWETLAPAGEPPVVIQVPPVDLGHPQDAAPLQGGAPSGQTPTAEAPSRDSAGSGTAHSPALALDALLPALWLAGAALAVLYRLVGTAWFSHRTRRWSRAPGTETLSLYASICRDMAVKRPPELAVSSAAGSPLVLGLLRPRLLLPGEEGSSRELAFIFRHELTHYRRRDLWYQLALTAALAIHWFNPLVYLLFREACVDMELTCDDAVVAGRDREERRAYGETLVAALHRQRGLSRAALSTHFYGGAAVMKERLWNLLGRRGKKGGALVLALALVATVSAACSVGLQKAPDPPSLTAEETENPPPTAELEDPDRAAAMAAAQDYVARQIEALESQGHAVTDSALELTEAGAFRWGFYDSDMLVWRLDYRLLLADSGAYMPVGGQEVDADGWLTGLDPLGVPYLIFSVYRGENPAVYRLAEVAYDNVGWEYGFCWETYAAAHTAMGLTLAPKLNAWPDTGTPFILARGRGEEEWAAQWETTAQRYLQEQLGLEGCTLSPLLRVDTGDSQADEDLLASFSSPSGQTGMLLLSHWNYAYGPALEHTAAFWEVVGVYFVQDLTKEDLAGFAAYFNAGERNGLLRCPYGSPQEAGAFLGWLFYDLDGGAADMTEEELGAVEAAWGAKAQLDMRKLPTSYVLDCLQQWFGISREMAEDILQAHGPLLGTYLADYDAYYSQRGDTERQEYRFDSGCRFQDGSVRLYYTIGYIHNTPETGLFDQPMYLCLAPDGSGGWYVERNLPAS